MRAADVEVVAVDVGPGLYTGLRVGIATAITMAHALGAAMVPATSLELVARAARADNRHEADRRHEAERSGRIDAVIDARRGELFHAAFTCDLEPISEPAVLDPHDLATMLAREAPGTLLVGDGVEAHPGVFADHGFSIDRSAVYPSAETIVELAAGAVSAGRAVSAASIRPLYLRGPDARPLGTVA